MAKDFFFTHRADFSSVIGQDKIIASSIGPEGEAVLLLVAPEFENAPVISQQTGGLLTYPSGRFSRPCPATFVRLSDHGVIQRTELPQVEISFPHVQPLPDGDVLLVDEHLGFRDGYPQEREAIVFNGEGKSLRQFAAGYGIEDVQATVDGKVWVSYFDEGVFSNNPISTSGLNCFDASGRIEWQFTEPDGFEGTGISDCYALNVAKEAVWTCYYTDFPLVKIESAMHVGCWKNEIPGARALAVDEGRVLFWSDYSRKDGKRCVVQEIGEDALVNPREITLAAR